MTALRPARTVFVSRVRSVPDAPLASGLMVLKSASGNRKVGKGKTTITKGRYRGMRLFTLTLEERATCPKTCGNWNTCYGDGSFLAIRHKPGAALVGALWEDCQVLQDKHPEGFVVRLHILGDFYSTQYVKAWKVLFSTYPALHVFGYTHWEFGTPIGDAVTDLVQAFPDRCSLMRSDGLGGKDPLPRAMTVGKHAAAAPGTVVCPEQTKRTQSCLTCGLCMNGETSVSFLMHHRSAK